MKKKYIWVLAAILTLTFQISPVLSDEDKKSGPSGYVTINSKEVGLLIGGQKGTGVLEYDGEEYPFKLKGMEVGAIGKSETDAIGKVYNLDDLEDFEGVYFQGKASLAVKDGKSGALLINRHGVMIRLMGDQEGAELSLGRGGIKIKFDEG